ncbi:MAG: hypothetical protein K2Y13_02645, partial [Burkholderiaceae bacterium]|nr:hypothetical protein [Burkholderiaceae bacterium]
MANLNELPQLAVDGKIFFHSGDFLHEALKNQKMRKWHAHAKKQKAHRRGWAKCLIFLVVEYSSTANTHPEGVRLVVLKTPPE